LPGRTTGEHGDEHAIGGVLVSPVALTVSLPVCLATVGFFVLYRLLEDYLLVPKIIGGV
jgi:hypothetical protein